MEADKIKVPLRQHNSRVERALSKVARDGAWHRLLPMGFTSAEQTARGYNVPGSSWVFGYTHEVVDGEMASVLWVRFETTTEANDNN